MSSNKKKNIEKGDMVKIVRGKYKRNTGVYVCQMGTMMCSVRIVGGNKDGTTVNIYKTSIERMKSRAHEQQDAKTKTNEHYPNEYNDTITMSREDYNQLTQSVDLLAAGVEAVKLELERAGRKSK